ncbi:hypothetical protein [Roseisolibacter sp. H3M3-2]|uniref:hypothetical protein n=1 Tax=Roseisolibacter sp. H3M3-2 TaxID=3031323 RepID=UPI0023DC7ADA|nr:hypothetical protein [Roseisolibacter sp. H3M3-2]MDF1502770.1 hypothetical protein [Roseisolibacter sp. H3M3-2]
MMRITTPRLVACAALLGACGGAAKDGADTAAAAPDTAAATADAADPTRVAAGAQGVPAGYTGRTDRPAQAIADAKYVAKGDGAWEVTTGPAHVLWAAGDTASGRYTARARFTQLEAPSHPEAFGVVVGGRDLEGEGQRYTYFIVRGTGEYLVRVREGAGTRDVRGWTAAPAVPKQDGSGRATYDLAVRVDQDSTRFLVGETPVFAVAAGAVPTDGVAGVRVNHNLHLELRPVAITR